MYAVLHVPRLALQAVLSMALDEVGVGGLRGVRSEAAPEPYLDRVEGAVVVVDAEAKKPVVLEMTEMAAKEGVVVGLSIPQALARCEGLVVKHRSDQAERMVEELLFAMAYSLSPRVEMDGAGRVLVDLRGAKIEEAIARCGEIVGELAAMGLTVGIGVAESWVVAGLAARAVEGRVLCVGPCFALRASQGSRGARSVEVGAFLAGLALGAVEMSGALRDVLEKWGIRSLAVFAGLKRSAVGARLGVEGLALWDRVTGREERVVAVAELPAEFVESWDFEYDVDSVEPLLFLLRRFLDTLGARMRAGHKVAAFARVELRLAYGEPVVVEQKLPEPTSDAGALFGLLAARLEEVEAESPVAAMELRLEVADFRERQLGLFESSLKNPYRFTQTLSRVAGIVGEDRVGRPVVIEDERPDGFRMEALPASVPPVGELDVGRMFGMPLRRYRPGRKAAVEFQGRMPIWIQCEGVSGFVKAVRGPWLHSGHWWEEKGSWNRVEWDVELNKGGVYRICKDELGWRVEGEY
ncbi:hypothetical protein VDG1235_754 [Verrucomicrobiia bacterium DG1235]|nr:hypothetical protein VDG1235_754 [Verrucomicrobiae bacterium DG1235]